MRKVIGIGETVLDIIFRNNQPIAAVAGGSSFNALTSLSRAGVKVSFISEVGNDRVGETIMKFLKDNGIGTDGVSVFPESKSPLSLAFLNEHNEADYVFYKDHPHDRLEFGSPDIQPDDIILFGSFFAVNPVIRGQVMALLEHARSRGAIIYYDVNYRSSHKDEVIKITANLLENLDYADIVRGSNEDFSNLFKMDDVDKVYESEISFYCKRFIYTQGAHQVELRAENGFRKSYPVPSTTTVSTIGAGDNFNAGFIFGLLKLGITRPMLEAGLTESQWDGLIGYAERFSAECCKDIYNYVSPAFGAEMKQELTAE